MQNVIFLSITIVFITKGIYEQLLIFYEYAYIAIKT